MKKRTASRAAGFVLAMGATVGLAGLGVSMTGAYFQDSESATASVTTGEVDLTVANSTPLSASFAKLMPGESGVTNTYTLKNVGTGSVDYYLQLANLNVDLGAANAGTSVSDGVISLTNNGAPGTSYEWPNVSTPVDNGDTVSYEWAGSASECTAGGPRLFIRDGQYNTWDGDPNSETSCGVAIGGGWNRVTGTVANLTGGRAPAGHVGIVHDGALGNIQVRNIIINGVTPGSAADVCGANPADLLVSVNGHAEQRLCDLVQGFSPVLVVQDVPNGESRTVSLKVRLAESATNIWASATGTVDVIATATQANKPAPTQQADQVGNDAH